MILVDTSIWIDFLVDPHRIPEARDLIKDFVTCGPVVQEVLQGFADRSSYQVFRERLLTFPRLSDPLPAECYVEAATIYREGRSKGITIGSAADCLIAAIAIEHDVPVWHRDRDFTNIARYTRLKVFNRYVT
jgi:predicted nucleic acid-binding protein